MKKILTILAVTTLAASPLLTAQVQAASKPTVTKQVNVKNGKRIVAKSVVTPKMTSARSSNRNLRYNASKVAATKVRWSKGQRFNSRIATNYRVISNPRAYRLKNAPRGQRWVQSGNSAVLIGISSGIVSAVIANAILR